MERSDLPLVQGREPAMTPADRGAAGEAESRARVTAIVGHRGMEDYLGEAVASILGQTMTDLRLVVVDDASEGERWIDVVRPFRDDARLQVFQTDRRVGVYRICNAVLERTSSPYVALQDADDVSHPERFARQIEALEAGTCDIAACSYEIIDDAGGHVKHAVMEEDGNARRERYGGFMALKGTLMMPQRVLRVLGGFDGTTVAGADSEFLLRAAHLFRIRNLPDMLYRQRHWTGQLTRSRDYGIGTRYRSSYRRRMLEQERKRLACRSREELLPLLEPPPSGDPVALRRVVL